MASNAENVPIWWRHHVVLKIQAVSYGNVGSFHGLSLLIDKLVFWHLRHTGAPWILTAYSTMFRSGTHHSCLQFNNHARMSLTQILPSQRSGLLTDRSTVKLFLYWSWYSAHTTYTHTLTQTHTIGFDTKIKNKQWMQPKCTHFDIAKPAKHSVEWNIIQVLC